MKVNPLKSCCVPTCCADKEEDEVREQPLANIKEAVQQKYGQIALAGGSCCDTSEINLIGNAYETVEGYVAEADLGLGCGLPTEHAGLEPGHVVLDLGSGAGLDAFVARKIVGEKGRVLGVDMTPSMIDLARANARNLGYDNVDFYLGDIEDLPFKEGMVDVVVSNCVLNLVPDKAAAFSEMYRVLKPGGHFCVSDVVHVGEVPQNIRDSVALYVGCIAGVMERQAYLDGIGAAGFEAVKIVKEKQITISDHIVASVLDEAGHQAYREGQFAFYSVTVHGVKPVR